MNHDRDHSAEEAAETELERQVATLLREAGTSFTTDPGPLADSGLRYGRARLRRRRAATAAAGLAVAAVGVAVAIGVTVTGGGLPDEKTPAPPADTDVEDGQGMLQTLIGLLPEDVGVRGASAEGPDMTASPYATLTIDSDTGPAELTVRLTQWYTSDWRSEAGCPDLVHVCYDAQLSTGGPVDTSLTWYEDADTPVDPDGPPRLHTEAWLEGETSWSDETPGMWQLAVSVTGDGEAEDDAPLSQEDLSAIAAAPVWDDLRKTVDERWAPATDSAGTTEDDAEDTEDASADMAVAPDRVRSTFRELAPSGSEIRDLPLEGDGSVAFHVGPEDGPARVGVHLSPPGTGDPAASAWTGCETNGLLDNGSTVYYCETEGTVEAAGGKGGAGQSPFTVMVMVLYPDSAELRIHAQAAPGDTELAGLTPEDVTEIAVADEWHAMFE
ncbi:hypothetical protein ACL02R_11790 [Streptomyces sp. MS19]|uniref:hypothetical protein n=1 Tax=Streptomyces sp. MS19 TaxID=3385972 RepID=UPI00399FAC35